MTEENLLDQFNKNIRGTISLTQQDIKTLETIGIEELDEIDKVGFTEVVKENLGQLWGYFIGVPVKTTENVVESIEQTGVSILSDFEKQLEQEIESVESGRDAIEYAKRAIIRSRLKKRIEDAAQYSANQIEYVASSTETAVEPFISHLEPYKDAGTAIADYAASNTTNQARNLLEDASDTATGILETIKQIPTNISNYATSFIPSPPSNPFKNLMDKFWTFVDSASDFFYIFCALVILGKFDFLLQNIYIVVIVTILLVYTINTR